MRSYYWLISLVTIYLLIADVAGASDIKEETTNLTLISVIAVVGGAVGLAVVIIICAETRVNPNVIRRGPPDWTNNLVLLRDLDHGFTDVSDGLYAVTANHVTRERLGISITDAARWNGGMTTGKHVFEVNWPQKNNRGFSSCIGIGSPEVPLKKQGRVSLVGDHSQSWGLDMAKQRTIHFGKVQQRLYTAIPDKYYMYVDMDSGMVSFGDDITKFGRDAEFYGNILTGIPKNSKKPFYLMVSMCQPKEQVQVFYRGSATTGKGFSLINGQPIYEDGSFAKPLYQETSGQANVVNVFTISGAPGAYPPYQGLYQQQGYLPPQQGYAPPPQGYAPPPQGYAPPPQGYAPPPQGYAPPPPGYAPPTQGYAPEGGHPAHGGHSSAIEGGDHKKKQKKIHHRSGSSSSSSSSDSDIEKKNKKMLKKLKKLTQ